MQESLGERIRTFCLWGAAAGLVFVLVYPSCNWITSQRAYHYRLYADWELKIPFWPEWVLVYLSMYLLFLVPPFFLTCAALRRLGLQLILTTLAAGATFLLVPATLGFTRVVPTGGPYQSLYQTMFALDATHNLVPSLHVTWSTAIAVAVADFASLPWRLFFFGWVGAIALSTLLVHQHHVIDVVVAYLFILIARKATSLS